MLLDVFAFWLVEFASGCNLWDTEAASDAARDDFLGVFDHMADLLREDRSLSNLLQIVHGPALDICQVDIDQFVRRGLLVRDQAGTIRPFSDTFATYLGMLDRETQDGDNLWPVWRRTEKALRRFIAFTLRREYGDHWPEALAKKHPKVSSIVDRCRESQMKEEKGFKGRASLNLLDFAYPADLFDLIFAEWRSIFEPLLGQDKNYWEGRKQLLSKLRNPLAHHRDEMLYDWERKTADGYCREVLAAIEAVQSSSKVAPSVQL